MSDRCERCGEVPNPDGKCACQEAGPSQAIFAAGELAAMTFKLDAEALERWLNTNPKGFRFEKECRAAIAFKRAISE